MTEEDRSVMLTMLGVFLIIIFALSAFVLNSENRAARYKLERDYYKCMVEATTVEMEHECFVEREAAEVRLEKSLL